MIKQISIFKVKYSHSLLINSIPRILPEEILNMVIKMAGEEEGIRRQAAGKAVEARIQEV